MKKRWGSVLTVAVLVILISGIYAYFRVDGKEIVGVSEINPSCTVTITKSYHMLGNKQNYLLDVEQTEKLKALILSSTFTRDLSAAVRFYDKDIYDIRIDFNDGQNVLLIHCIGNEYISVTTQFDGKHLRIKNPNWKSTLETIISKAEPMNF